MNAPESLPIIVIPEATPPETVIPMETPVTQDANSLEPGEIPSQPESVTPRAKSPPIREETREVDEEPSAAESDPRGFSDEGATESSSSHATPVNIQRGRKSKKKQREEKSYAYVLQDSQKTLKSMMNTRSKIAQASKGTAPSQSK